MESKYRIKTPTEIEVGKHTDELFGIKPITKKEKKRIKKMSSINSITQEANKRINKKYPLLEEPIKEWMTEVIVEILKEK